ncbi:MAG: PD-(D/E)XK nuclease family protein [Candidatus Omnitrophica bacterium]|nr:PD-(D/E)XK nuclease family protein [Candidatus Omnitrophota bacterium]
MASKRYNNSYPSVTQVLGVLRKIGLEYWFKYNTAQFCNAESKKGLQIGSQIHEAIQSQIEEKEVKIETQYGEEVKTALEAFMMFKKDRPDIQLKKAEIKLTSEKYKFNGTMDCLAEIDGTLIMADWKTGKNRKERTKPDIYDEHLYQVSAYVMAYNEQEGADIKRAFILAIAKNGVSYNYKELSWNEIRACFHEVFLPCLQIFNYQERIK